MSVLPLPYIIHIDRPNFQVEIWQRSELKREYVLKKEYPCALGKIGHDTPSGLYWIHSKVRNPSWTIPNVPWAVEAGYVPGTKIPGGADNNPLKGAFLQITDDPTGNIGIHGTAALDSLGLLASHGCIRVEPKVAVHLFHLIPKNTPVWML